MNADLRSALLAHVREALLQKYGGGSPGREANAQQIAEVVVPAILSFLATDERFVELSHLLRQCDGQLGLAVYRGEGGEQRWKQEASELISRIRKVLAALGDLKEEVT